MDIGTVKSVFMWCVIISGGLLTISSLLCTFAGTFVYKMHGKWYPMPRETFNVVLYSFVGLYKVLFLLFVLAPYIALVIVG